MSFKCPNNSGLYCGESKLGTKAKDADPGSVNCVMVEDIILDTWSSKDSSA